MSRAKDDGGAAGAAAQEERAEGAEIRESGAPAAGDEELRLMRQPSLLSLTLDEFQSAVRGPGKSFGSMNMDEFLTNIWTTEEGNVTRAGDDEGQPPGAHRDMISVPEAMSGKTVEEVWSDIQWDRPAPAPENHQQDGMGSSQRQLTLGEMTLEDFLVKAGVVREGGQHHPRSSAVPLKQIPVHGEQLQQPQDSYGMHGGYQPRQAVQPAGGGVGGWNSYGGGGERTRNGRGGAASPLSPTSSESLDRPWDGGGSGRGAAAWGRKRGLDGPAEKVVERRQRRMMKNRESAARSRARKQAYTVELEKELTFLKEENARLKDEQRKSAEWRRQTLVESMAEKSKTTLRREAKSGGPGIRLCRSCLW